MEPVSEVYKLLRAIHYARMDVQKASTALLDLQHRYLELEGFTIEPAQGGFAGELVYRQGNDETFLDVTSAVRYAERRRAKGD